MIIYKRHIEKKLFSLRLSFVILSSICVFAFLYHYDKVGYFISIVFLTLSVIVVKDFIVNKDSIKISKFYFFGLIKRGWLFNKTENIEISTFGTDFGEDGDVTYIESGDSFPMSILSFFLIFGPPKITMNEFKVEKFSDNYSTIDSVRILLCKHEFNYLKSALKNE